MTSDHERRERDAETLFSRTEYRRVIAWPERIRREAPFFDRCLGASPGKLLDVGSGTGEHARHFAERGWRVVGVDVAEHMIELANDHAGTTETGGSVRFELRNAADAAGLPEAPFDAAISIGNMLAFVEDETALRRLLRGVAQALAPDAPFLVQLLNYERIVNGSVRALGVNVRPLPEEEGEGDIVFVRVFRPRADGALDFFPITLTVIPDADPPAVVRSAKRGRHTPWLRDALLPAFESAGFDRVKTFGTMADVPFDTSTSPDLVLLGYRRSELPPTA
jgi:SAM-dependent methyltransferase